MTATLLLLTVCYAALAMLIVALCLFTRWPFWVKTSAVITTAIFSMLSYDALSGVLGFPSQGRLPERFVVHSAVAAQPNKGTGDKGVIYVWVTALTKDGPAKQPRAYQIEFDKEVNKTLTEALRRGNSGITQIGQTFVPEERESSSTVSRFMSSNKTQRFKITDMPDPSLPEK